MRIALDMLTVQKMDDQRLDVGDEFGNSVELYVHTDPREAYIRLSALIQAAIALQHKLPPAKPYTYLRNSTWPA